MMYQDIYNCICQNTKKWRYTIHYVKPTVQLLFKSRFSKGGPTCRRQVVNPRHHGSYQTPTILFESKTHKSINSYTITYAVKEFLLSIISNSVTVLSLQWNVFATIDRCSIMTGMYRRSMMIYSRHRLNLRGPSITVVFIGMEYPTLVTLLLVYLNRLTKRSRYFGNCNIWLDATCQVFLLHREQDFCNFCCNPSNIKSSMEEV